MNAEDLNFPNGKQTCQQDSLIGRLFHFAQTTPQNQAIASLDNSIHYSKLAKLVVEQVDQLQSRGISKDSVVAVQCKDEVLHLVLTLALIYIGAPSFALETSINEEEKKALLRRLDITNVIDESNAISLDSKGISASPARPSKDLPSYSNLYFSTSGTSGTPKIVVLRDQDIVEQAPRHIQSNSERFACIATIEYNFARRHRLYCLAMGACNVFLSKSCSQNPSLIDQCQQLNVNVLHVSSFQAQSLLGMENLCLLQGIRLKLGGSHVPLALREELRQSITGNLQAGYGTTETGAICFTDPKDLNSSESVGKALPGVTIKIIDKERKEQAEGARGEILISAKGLFREYLGMKEKTEERIQDGWFNTGDIGYLDKEGRLFLSGRADDMFTFNSINIYPQDIESELIKHPAVRDAAVFAKSSDVHGQIPIAFVTLKRNQKIGSDKLKTHFKEKLGIRCPKQFSVVSEIPRNTAGKLNRKSFGKVNDAQETARKCIVSILKNSAKKSHDHAVFSAFLNGESDIKMNKIQMDSLTRLELLVALEIECQLCISPSELGKMDHLGDIISRIDISDIQRNKKYASPQIQNQKGKTPKDHYFPNDLEYMYPIKLVNRVYRKSKTVANLYRYIERLENRLTPSDFYLLVQHTPLDKDATAINSSYRKSETIKQWIHNWHQILKSTNKELIEPFEYERLDKYLTLFKGPGDPKNKDLIVCFSGRGGRKLSTPNFMLLQCTNASTFDLLVISEPLGCSYLEGVPGLGRNIRELAVNISQLPLLKKYKNYNTIGYSAGAYPALVTGFEINAKYVISAAARFERFREQPIVYISKLLNLFIIGRKKHKPDAFFIFSDKTDRDRKLAQKLRFLISGHLMPIAGKNKREHQVLDVLAKKGELRSTLEQVIEKAHQKH